MSDQKQVPTVKKDGVPAMTTENTPLAQPHQEGHPPKGDTATAEKPKTVDKPSEHPPKK